MAVAGAVLSVYAARWGAPLGRYMLTWWELAPAVAVASGLGFHIEIKGEAYSFSLCELPLVLGCLLAPPWAVIIGRLAGEAAFQLAWRRQRGLKLGFVMARALLAAVVVIVAFHQLVPPAATVHWASWPLVLAAAAAGEVVGVVADSCSVFWHGGRARALPVLSAAAVMVLCNVNLALLCAEVLRAYPPALVLLALVLGLTSLILRAYANVSKRYASLKLLYEFTKVVGASTSAEDILDQVLLKACDLMAAERAEVVLFDRSTGQAALRLRNSSSGPRREQALIEEPGPEGAPWAELARGGHAMLVPRTDRSPLQVALRDQLGARDLLLAPLRSDDGVIGAIMVCNRLGNVSTFDDADCRLFETLANHASVAFENSRLVHRLRQEAEERSYEALHDSLTGLPNRVMFAQEVDLALEKGEPAVVMLMDLDGFKEVNDTLGHHNGDALLCEVAARIRQAMRPCDVASRLGGDEFAMLLPHVSNSSAAQTMALRVLDALNQPFVVDDLTIDVAASVGIALAPDHGTDASTLLKRADVAMYQAKTDRCGASLYMPDLDTYSPRRLALTNSLRQGIGNGDMMVYFQPKVEVSSGRVTGAEALVRWRHPDLGTLPPDDFIPAAEQSGLIAPLTTYVLRAALRQCSEWRRGGLDMGVAVNLAVRSLLDVNLPSHVADILAETGARPEWLTLEVTESSVMADPDRTISVLERLASAGVRLSLDDFGTGYSSLSYLRSLPVHEVKVDKSFVFGMSTDSADATIVQSIIELGHNLGLAVVAEGVEDQMSWDCLRSMACDVAQGYHLSKPVPAAAVTRWLIERDRQVPALPTLRVVSA